MGGRNPIVTNHHSPLLANLVDLNNYHYSSCTSEGIL